jgi:predicted transcriptional regulator
MAAPKEVTKQLIDYLTDHASWDEIMHKLHVRSKIEEGMADIEAGRTTPHEGVKADTLNR